MLWIVLGYIGFRVGVYLTDREDCGEFPVLMTIILPVLLTTALILGSASILLCTGGVEYETVSTHDLLPIEGFPEDKVNFAVKRTHLGSINCYDYIKVVEGGCEVESALEYKTVIAEDDTGGPRVEKKEPRPEWWHWLITVPLFNDCTTLYIPAGSVQDTTQ